MADSLVTFWEKPPAKHVIAGWRRQWSDGGDISSGLPRYLIEKLSARKIGEMSEYVNLMCYPFQVAGTHDAYRPRVSFRDGLPTADMHRENAFYDAGDGLIIFRGEEPWQRIDIYGQAFFEAIKELGVSRTASVEGYNGPAPPELERNVNCVFSMPDMKEELEKLGIGFSSYGSERRAGPTIGMAMVTMAHYHHPGVEMVRMGAMAPMYPFLTRSNEQVGIQRDHRAFYDIMRRLKAMFGLTIDLGELESLGASESRNLQETLDRIGASDRSAKQIIDRAMADYKPLPFDEPVDLTPELDRTLEDIIRNMPEQPGGSA